MVQCLDHLTNNIPSAEPLQWSLKKKKEASSLLRPELVFLASDEENPLSILATACVKKTFIELFQYLGTIAVTLCFV